MGSLLGLTLLLAFLLCSVTASSAHSPKLGPRIGHFLSQGERDYSLPRRESIPTQSGSFEETTAIWILFNSKCADETPSRPLSDRALARRAKHGVTTDVADHALCSDWKHQLARTFHPLQHTPILRGESQWLNAVSYTVAISDLPYIVPLLIDLPFVAEVEIVGRMIRDSVKVFEKSEHLELVSSELLADAEAVNSNNRHSSLQRRSGDNVQQQTAQRDTLDLDYGTSLSQLERIGIPAMHRQNLDGSGVIISVLDSGFNQAHESLRNLQVLDAWDFVHNDGNVADEPGETSQSNHGTATWSNIGARMPGKLYGGAYNASYILCKTEDTKDETIAEEDYFVHAIEYSEVRGADILSASLGYMDWYKWSDLDGYHSPISRVANRAVDVGMLFVVANGNAYSRGIGTPADLNRVLSIGALAANPPTALASFSSLGPTYDGRIKPEVSAPGQYIKVALYNSVTGYTTLSGTSFATPLTAGVVALLLQAHPTWTNMNLRDAIMQTATPTGTSPPNIQFGWGIVNGPAALLWNPPSNPSSQCSPNGSWNATVQRCDCNKGWYNSDCQTQVLSCRSWCLTSNNGLCSTTDECMCTSRSPAGRCTTDNYYLQWTCSNTAFNDGAVCNCGCGFYDPDCDIPNAPVSGCTNSTDTCYHDTSTHRGICSSLLGPAEPTEPIAAPIAAANPETVPNVAPVPPKAAGDTHFNVVVSILISFLSLLFR